MKEAAFVMAREPAWQDFERLLAGGKITFRKNAGRFPHLYREIAADLNTARAERFDPAIAERLNRLVMQGSQRLYGGRSFSPAGAVTFILRSFPRTVRAQWRPIGICMLLFYGLALASGILCYRYPDLVRELLGSLQCEQIEEMYDPESPHYARPRAAAASADMFGFYIYNNISIAFRTFAGGILAGLGSLLFLCINAISLGASTALVTTKGFAGTFFPFVIAHSALEITAIIFSGAAGLVLGWSLFVTRGLTRGASLRQAGRRVLPLIAGAALMLAMAAVIEAFWSSKHELPMALRLGVGAGVWALTLIYFLAAGRGGDSASKPRSDDWQFL
ncbi:MAG: stage II sporulation protein M [Treponema sp.]|jgi:uncharacterized membrane protein SpoIIM required for sporulation|nr:stage II sporulation protein M [Treponema sp.]